MYHLPISYNLIFKWKIAKKRLKLIELFNSPAVFIVSLQMENRSKIFDGLLVLQVQAGNKNAMNRLIKRYHLKLCHHAMFYSHDMAASQDIVQDSWSIIMKKLNTLRDPNSFGSWAFKIVTRKALDYTNRMAYERDKLQHLRIFSLTADEVKTKERHLNQLQEAIGTLPANQQIVLRLFYTAEFSLDEIAGILEISSGTVKSRLYHAREKLKTILKK